MSQAIWLICENDPNVRVERFLRLWHEDKLQLFQANKQNFREREQKTYYDEVLEDWQTAFRPIVERLTDEAGGRRVRTPLNLLECIEVAAEFVGVALPYRVNVLWPVAGGYAHGRPWAWIYAGTSKEAPDEDGGQAWVSSINLKMIAHMIGVVVVSLQYCHWLINERSGVVGEYKPLLKLNPASRSTLKKASAKQ